MHALGCLYEKKALRLHRQAAEAGLAGSRDRARALLALGREQPSAAAAQPRGMLDIVGGAFGADL